MLTNRSRHVIVAIMPWEKQFNTEEVLDRAMHVFWRHGFEATSMQVLLDNMGIQRGSFYATFQDKRTIFKMALERYEKLCIRLFERIEAGKCPKEAIASIFDGVIKEAQHNTDYCGCFMVNTSLELAPHDPEIGAMVEKCFSLTEAFFHRMIRKGQAEGTIASSLNAKSASRVLFGLLAGLRVLSRGRANLDSARAVVAHAKTIIG
jgi:TetR/AcrR family transcriptional repressor of nem operon